MRKTILLLASMGVAMLLASLYGCQSDKQAGSRSSETTARVRVAEQKESTGGALYPTARVKTLTNQENWWGKITRNWGVAARCCGGTGRHYGAKLPAGYQRQGAQSETIGRQTGRGGSLFRVSRPV